MKRIRCAIYTRKSSEEGLEQDFNSLHAQREACAAYVASQASEGWQLLPESYDDGGISGGTLERPALQRLLADIAEGQIDIVVVYKVDRLTRSLLDFSKLVEAFDKAEVSFVSITQSFNTTTSMGRLTLNMLLSFAQFEREVTAERIRDKIAASKARGMWMGGTPPLGYRANGRSLAIVEEEAALLRYIFAEYLRLGSVRALAEALQREGVKSPIRTFASGRSRGGVTMTRGALYHLLSNPLYIGRIRHRDKTYDGLHEGIVDQQTWDAVQQLLADNRQGEERHHSAVRSLLAGKVVDGAGEALIASHDCKNVAGATSTRARYRYYIGRSIQNGSNAGKPEIRIPAKELEAAVTSRIAEALEDPLELALQLCARLDIHGAALIEETARELAARVKRQDYETLRSLVAAVHVLEDEVRIELAAPALVAALRLSAADGPDIVTLISPVRIKRTGLAVRMVFADGRGVGDAQVKPSMVKLLIRARGWWARMASGDVTREILAREANVEPSYVSRVIRLAFLSPKVVEAILSGRHPARLDAGRLLVPGFPARWREQELAFLGG